MQAFLLGFCSSGYDFAIASSRHHLTVITLQVAMRFVGNYALRGLSPQTDGMPVIPKRVLQKLWGSTTLRDKFEGQLKGATLGDKLEG